MKFKGILFDLDGVLVHTDKLHYRAWKKIADARGILFNEEINNLLRGVSRMESLEIILRNYHGPALSQEEKEALAEEKNNYYKEELKSMTPDLSCIKGSRHKSCDWFFQQEYQIYFKTGRTG